MSDCKDREPSFQSFDWNEFSLEQLKLIQSQISKAISLKKRDLKLSSPTVENVSNYRYKASLAKVFPLHLRNSLPEYQKCVLIISLGSKNFVEDRRIEATIKWISQNFKTCLVLVGDSVYRLTIEIKCEGKRDKARLEALNTGEMFIRDRRSLFEQYSENCNFEFQLASDIEKRPDFKIYYEEFQKIHQNNESFQNLVDAFSQTYLDRVQPREGEQVIEFQQKNLATTYLLEESALFACLAEEGRSVFVYPGSIKTFEEISEGLHPEVPETLKKIIWVSLRLKKRSANSSN